MIFIVSNHTIDHSIIRFITLYGIVFGRYTVFIYPVYTCIYNITITSHYLSDSASRDPGSHFETNPDSNLRQTPRSPPTVQPRTLPLMTALIRVPWMMMRMTAVMKAITVRLSYICVQEREGPAMNDVCFFVPNCVAQGTVCFDSRLRNRRMTTDLRIER